MYFCCPFKLYYPCYTGCPLNFGNEICGRYRSATFQAILAVLGHLLLFKKSVFWLIFQKHSKFFFRLISGGNPLGLLKASESRGLQIDFGSLVHGIADGGHQQARTWHDCILIQFGTWCICHNRWRFNRCLLQSSEATFFYGLSPYLLLRKRESYFQDGKKPHQRASQDICQRFS